MSKKSELISLKDANEYETNPYIIELKDKMYIQPRANSIIAKGQAIMDTETGEILDETVLMGKRKYVDKSQFSKLYASSLGIIYGLSRSAQNVFMYLSTNMDYDNRVYFNYSKQHDKLGYKSETAPLNGLRELLSNDIIACDIREHTYWLNPTIVCKGERFAMYTEYVVQKKKDLGESMSKKQGRDMYGALDEEVQKKVDLANKRAQNKQESLFNSDNKNPYKE